MFIKNSELNGIIYDSYLVNADIIMRIVGDLQRNVVSMFEFIVFLFDFNHTYSKCKNMKEPSKWPII